MPFVFTTAYEFDWPVSVAYPANGASVEAAFTGRFRLPDDDEARGLFAPTPEGATAEEIAQTDRARMASVLVGWSGVMLEGGKEFPFTPENRDVLLRQRPVAKALWSAFAEAVLLGRLREKN